VDNIGTVERAICECDNRLATTLLLLDKPNPKYQEYKKCEIVTTGKTDSLPSCCANSEGIFRLHNGDISCCDASGSIKSIG
jgi:hypothetical protein